VELNSGDWCEARRPYRADPLTVLKCAEPSAAEACLPHTNISDVRAGYCGVSDVKRIYRGRACAFCGVGSGLTLGQFDNDLEVTLVIDCDSDPRFLR